MIWYEGSLPEPGLLLLKKPRWQTNNFHREVSNTPKETGGPALFQSSVPAGDQQVRDKEQQIYSRTHMNITPFFF